MGKAKYEVEKAYYKDLKSSVKIPQFQRSFVWSNQMKKDLIKTIYRGLPIGTLLLAKRRESTLIIDGRQRFSTLIDYEKDPSKYIDDDEYINSDKIEDILNFNEPMTKHFNRFNREAKNEIIKDIKNIILRIIKNEKNLNTVKFKCVDLILTEVPYLKEHNQGIKEIIPNFLDDLYGLLDIDNLKIPVIIFDGEDNEIVDTFINLNKKGTKLSKYDIYAASWHDDIVNVDDKEIINAVIEKYESALDFGLEIEGFNAAELKENKKVNVFEYAYSISKIISEKCNFIYKAKEVTEIDSLGFSILAGIFGIENKNMEDLSNVIVTSKVDLGKLKDKIVEISLAIETILEPWIRSIDNKKDFTNHSELQLASYIVVLFKLKYDLNPTYEKIPNRSNGKKVQNFKAYLHKHYLYDIVRGYWSGSGDTKLDALINQYDDCRYLSDVSKNSFEQVLLDWLTEQNSSNKINIPKEQKLFLNYLVKSNDIPSKYQNIDFDHIIPRSRLESMIKRNNVKVTISTPSNLVIIPSFDNRSKRESTYFELLDNKQTLLKLTDDILEKYYYPRREEIRFIESFDDFTHENYTKFLKNRSQYLVNSLLKNLYD